MRAVFIRHSKPLSYQMTNNFSWLHYFLLSVVEHSSACDVAAILLILFAVLKGGHVLKT